MAIPKLFRTLRRRLLNLTPIRPVSSCAVLLLLAALPPLAGKAPAQQASAASQYDIQAVYLFNFAKFVRWPPMPENETITICVAADKRYIDTLAKVVKDEKIDSHPVAARAIHAPEDEAGCSLVFVGVAAKDHLDPLLAATTGKPILTVSDVPGFLDRSGMIQFLVIANRVRFSVNLHPVSASGLSLSSELLKVAVAVNGNPTAGGAQ